MGKFKETPSGKRKSTSVWICTLVSLLEAPVSSAAPKDINRWQRVLAKQPLAGAFFVLGVPVILLLV